MSLFLFISWILLILIHWNVESLKCVFLRHQRSPRRIAESIRCSLADVEWQIDEKISSLEGAETTSKVKASSNLSWRSNSVKYDRTNRLEFKWLNELCLLRNDKATTGNEFEMRMSLILMLAKELLHSNIPEQVVDLYRLYHEIIVENNETEEGARGTTEVPIVPNSSIIGVTLRALLRLDDFNSAMRLLRATGRSGIEFDADAKTALIIDLAEFSPQGLRAALQIRASMKNKGEIMGTTGQTRLLKGIYRHGFRKPHEAHLELLVKSTNLVDEDGVIIDSIVEKSNVEKDCYYLPSSKAVEISSQILKEHMKKKEGKKINNQLVSEALRVLFRAGMLQCEGMIHSVLS